MKASRGALLAAGLLLAGCATRQAPPPPGTTTFSQASVELPAQLLDNYLLVEAKWDKSGPYRFLIDTGSSATLVSPELARRYAVPGPPPAIDLRVQVRSSSGETTVLPAITLTGIELGEVRFATVPALIYDCSALSASLGLKIDGVLGFPLFHATRLTLDYPRSRIVLEPATAAAPRPGATIPFNDADKTPFIPVRLGERAFRVLIDSGTDEALSLNADGSPPKFAFGPIAGPTAGTLTGDRTVKIGRLADTLFIGTYAVPRPVAEITGGLSALGGGILKNFAVTFDQARDEVTFFRDATDPIAVPSRRGTGVSFDKTPAYWRVVGIVPGSPAAAAGVEPGDLVTHVNGEPMERWDTRRYEQLLANGESVTYTFLNGTRETDKRLKVAELVP